MTSNRTIPRIQAKDITGGQIYESLTQPTQSTFEIIFRIYNALVLLAEMPKYPVERFIKENPSL